MGIFRQCQETDGHIARVSVEGVAELAKKASLAAELLYQVVVRVQYIFQLHPLAVGGLGEAADTETEQSQQG